MYYFKFDSVDFSDKYRFLIIIYNAIWILVCLMLKLYQIKQLKRLDRILFNLFKAFVFNAMIISAVLFSLKASEFSREHLYATYLMLLILIIFGDLLLFNQLSFTENQVTIIAKLLLLVVERLQNNYIIILILMMF